MIDAPYTTTTVDQVIPGDRIHDDKEGVVVLDEIRRAADGYHLLGWPAHRSGSGRRVSMPYKGGDTVLQLAHPDDGVQILDALAVMVADANQTRTPLEPDPSVEGDRAVGEPWYRFLHGQHPCIEVRAAGRLWRVPVAQALVIAPPALDPSPAPAADADAAPEVD